MKQKELTSPSIMVWLPLLTTMVGSRLFSTSTSPFGMMFLSNTATCPGACALDMYLVLQGGATMEAPKPLGSCKKDWQVRKQIDQVLGKMRSFNPDSGWFSRTYQSIAPQFFFQCTVLMDSTPNIADLCIRYNPQFIQRQCHR